MANFDVFSAVEYVINNNTLCQPLKRVRDKLIYQIDLNEFKDFTQILNDDNGTYVQNGDKKKHYEIRNIHTPCIRSMKKIKCTNDAENKDIYSIRKRYYYSKANPSFFRRLITIKSVSQPQHFNRCVVIYYWHGGERNEEFIVPVHGNSTKYCVPFYTTNHGTLIEVISQT